jgi:hypothetical protein
MAAAKYYALLFLLFASCESKRDSSGPIGIGKYELPYEECRFDSTSLNNSCSDAFLISYFDIKDSTKIDTVNKFVIDNYSKEKAKKFSVYSVVFYIFDFYGMDGINENSDFYKEVQYGEYVILEYLWRDGTFEALYYPTDLGSKILLDSIKGL